MFLLISIKCFQSTRLKAQGRGLHKELQLSTSLASTWMHFSWLATNCDNFWWLGLTISVGCKQAFSQLGVQASCGWPLIKENHRAHFGHSLLKSCLKAWMLVFNFFDQSIHISYWTICCVVWLSIFTSCAVKYKQRVKILTDTTQQNV